jgi:uncharacterized protein YegL
MSDLEQVPFGGAEFADNPEPRCACVLLLDTSTSMKGAALDQLNDGLVDFGRELAADPLATKRVEIAVVTFGPVRLVSDFQTPEDFRAPRLETTGDTPTGAAIELALELVRKRKDTYRANGISYYRPWIFMITDGLPTDSWDRAAALIREGEADKHFSFFAVGVAGADMTTLAKIAVREPLRLSGLRFRDLFSWLSSSLSQVSHSQVGQSVGLRPPTGWAEV